jgi:hypothetical protein
MLIPTAFSMQRIDDEKLLGLPVIFRREIAGKKKRLPSRACDDRRLLAGSSLKRPETA